jgi:hypothetical protein
MTFWWPLELVLDEFKISDKSMSDFAWDKTVSP